MFKGPHFILPIFRLSLIVPGTIERGVSVLCIRSEAYWRNSFHNKGVLVICLRLTYQVLPTTLCYVEISLYVSKENDTGVDLHGREIEDRTILYR